MPDFLRKRYLFFVFGGFILPISSCFAQTVVSPSSPLTDICIGDTRTLSNITVVETSVSGFSTSGSFILTPPPNFEFVTSTGTINTVGGDLSSSGSVTTSSEITVNLTVSSTVTFDLFEITGLQVKAIAPSSFGNITRAGGTFVAGGQANGVSTSYGFLSSISPPIITSQPTDKTVCSGNSVTLSVIAEGSGLSYQWQNDISGSYANISGATTSTFFKSNILASDGGNYRVIVTGSSSCVPISVTSNPIILAVDLPASIVGQPVGQTFCVGGDINLSVSATGTNLTYQWKKNGVDIPSATASTYTKLNTVLADAGNYSVAIASGITCASSLVISNNAVITINSLPAATISYSGNPFCATGAVNVTRSGQGAGTYSSTVGLSIAPSTGLIDLASTTPGTYIVSYNFTDGTCPNSATTSITINSLPTISGTLLICGTGTSQLTGSGTAAVLSPWLSSAPGIATVSSTGLVTGVSAGSTVITYTNVNGCQRTVVVTVNSLPTISGTLSICGTGTSQLTGSGTAAVSSPWLSSAPGIATVSNTGLVTGLSVGSTTITYTDINGCQRTANVNISSVPTISGTLSICGTGTSQLTGSGTAAVSSPWLSSAPGIATVSNTGLVTGVSAGSTTITYTDVNGCQMTAVITINSLPTISGTLSICGTGTSQLTGSGAAAVSSPWLSSAPGIATVSNTGLVTGLSVGSTTITYTDINGCQRTAIVTINSLPTISGTLSICGTGTSQLTGSGTSAVSSPWLSSAPGIATVSSTGLVTGVSAGSTTITYTDINGCQMTAVATVNPLPAISGTLSICGTGTSQLTGSGTAAVSSPWLSSAPGVATVSSTGLVTGVSAGSTTIAYTDFNGCQRTVVVTINSLPTISGTLSICGTGTSQLTGSGTAAVSSPWLSSAPGIATVSNTGLVTGLSVGSTMITYTDINGCQRTVNVNINSVPTISGTLLICGTGTSQLTGSGTAAISSPWLSSAPGIATVSSTGLVTGVSAGSTTITYTDINGCQMTAVVTINSLPTISGTLSICGTGTSQLTGSGTAAVSSPWLSSAPGIATVSNTGLVTGLSVGSTTITYTDINGCQRTAVVTINSLPTISGTLSICGTGTSQLTGSGTAAMSSPWLSSAPGVATVSSTGLVTGVSAGSTTITYTDINGCQMTTVATVNPLPTISGTLSICGSGTSQLTGSGTAAVSSPWLSSAPGVATVSSTGLVTGVSAGSTTIAYTDINGCQRTAVVTINALPSTSAITGPINVCANSSGTIYSVVNSVGSTYSWSVSGGVQTSGTTTNSITVTWDASPTGSLTITETSSAGCIGSLVSLGVSKSVCNVDVTISNPSFSLCRGATSGNLFYSGTIGSPDAFRLDFDATAEMQGFVDVPFAASNLSGSPISIVVPPNALPGNYSASFTVRNSGNTFQSPSYPITVTIKPIPLLSSTVTPPAICSGTVFNYAATSVTGGSTFAWSRALVSGISQTANSGSGDVNETLTNTTSAPISVTYQYITTSNDCSSGIQNVVVVVNPIPILSSTLVPPAVCSGTAFNYFPASATAGSGFTWSRALVGGISQSANAGTGIVNELLTNTTNAPISVTYEYTTTANGCSGITESVVVVVNPIPVLNSTLAPAAICSGTAFNYVPSSVFGISTFSWVRGFVSGISESTNSGIGNVTETLTNTSTAPINVTYQYKTTANGCSGIENVVVVVNPTPVLSSTLVASAICSGANFNYLATSATVGSSFTWSRAMVAGVAEAVSSGTGNVNEILTNTTAAPISVTYQYTVIANDCSSSSQNVVVVVNPSPVLSSTLSPSKICSGTIFSYSSASATSASTFNWSRALVGGISQGASTGTGNVNETLTNTTTAPIDVTYQYTTTANGCSGITQSVVVTVSPTPVLSSSLNPTAICSGSTFNYVAASSTAGSTFSWVRGLVAGISQSTSSGTGDVTELLSNTTIAPINVTYQYISTSNGCSSSIQNVVVVVNPIPVLSSTLSPPAICSETIFTYVATSATSGSSFSWIRPTIAGIDEAASSGTSIVNEVLTNSTDAPISVTYQFTTSANSCTGVIQNVVVVVNPKPALSTALTPLAICSGTTFNYPVASATVGSTFAWSRVFLPGISQLPNSGSGDINEILTNTTTAPINVTYQYIAKANGCTGSTQNVSVVVNPIPVLNSSLAPPTICSGTAFSYIATSATVGSTFNWSRPTVGGISQSANTGVGDVLEVLTNTTGAPISVNYRFTTTANNCSSGLQNLSVIVNHTPVINLPANREVCNGSDSPSISFSGTGTDYGWTNSNTLIGLAVASGNGTIPLFNASNDGNTPLVSTVSVTPEFAGNGISCLGSPANFNITVHPTPSLAVSDAAPVICNGLATNIVLTNSNNIPGTTTYNWTTLNANNLSGATSSSGTAIVQTLTSINGINSGTVVYRITATSAFGCQNSPTFVPATVLPPPNFSLSNTTPVICDRGRVDVLITSNVSNAQIRVKNVQYASVSGGLTVGSLFVNNQRISEALFNNTTAPVTVTYTLEAIVGACPASPEQVTTVLVNPTPVFTINNSNSSQCSGSNTNIILSSPTTNSTIALDAISYNGVTGGTSTVGSIFSSGQSIVETLANNGSLPANVFYTFSASASGCPSLSSQTASVLVNPNPTFSLANGAINICSSSSTNILFSSTVSGAQISLKSVSYGAVVGSLSPGALFVNGQRLAETLLNTTNAPITVVYEFVASVGLCGPSASTFTSVTVAPNPVMTITNSSPIICSGDPTSILINSTTVGSVITLTAVNYNGISGTRNVGDTFVNGESITEVLTNTTNTTVNVTYSFSVSATGCTNPVVQTISVTVNPVPTFLVANSSTSICSGSRANISFSSTVLGEQIRLKSINYGAATGTLLAGALFTNGQSITNFLFNNSNSPTTVVFEFEGFVGTCLNSTPQTASVIVNPNPTFAVAPSATTVCSGSPVNLQFSSPTSGHQINLVGVNYGLISGGALIAGTSVFFDGNSVNETLVNNTNTQLTVTYVFNVTTPSTVPSCPINTATTSISITVEPAPRFTVLNSIVQLCSGSQTSITVNTPVAGAQMRLKAVNYGGVTGSITYLPGTVFANNSTITEVLQNPVVADRVVEYSFEAQVGSCAASAAQIASVTVSQAPSLILTNNAPSICTGNSTDFQVRSNNSNPVITLSSVNYNGLTGGRQLVGAIYSSGQVINEVLVNTTNFPLTVVYSFTVSASGCISNLASNVSVEVNPLPRVSFSGLIDQVADNDVPFGLTGNQSGGLFSITPATSRIGSTTVGLADEVIVNPSLLTLGINTVRYTYQDANGCTNFISQAFSVVKSTAIDFIVNGFTSNTNDEFEVCADIGRIRLVGSPSLSEGVAPDTKFSTPGRLVFFDGKDYFLDTDGTASGIYSIRYDFKNSLNATTSRTKTIKILASPRASIEAANSCITDAIPFKDLSTINTTPFPSSITAWKWEFGEGIQSSLQNPSYTFPVGSTQPGVKTISLTVTTNQGCSNKTSKTIRVGPKPIVDFDWSAICDQDLTTFTSSSSVQFSTISNYSWDFGDGKTAVGSLLSSTQNRYSGPNVYNAKLSVKTNDGCTSAISKKVFILPFKSITTNQGYVEDFETSNGNWTPVSIEPNSDTSWRWSNPSGKTISKINPRALTSTKAWWTGKFYPTTSTYGNNEKSAVNGPCLNIASLKRPMIAFDYFVDTQTNIDGAVLQYFDNTERKWLNIGVKDEGISWYNATGITSNPGSQEFLRAGWTGNSTKEWANARFNLDTIPILQRGKVAIRIAFSSDGSNPTIAGNTYDGFAFDNVFIGEKQRNVLIERFTNSSLKVYADEDAYVSNLYDNQIKLRNNDPASSNFNFIQYHINFPGLDSLNFYNPNDPAARASFFSITQPVTIADGATDNKFRPSTAGAKSYLDARSLVDPQFDLSLSAKQGTAQNKISFDLTVTRRPSFIGAATLLFYVALVENNVEVKNKDGQFRNVLRKQLLGGDGVTRIWTANQPFIKESFTDIPLVDCKINNPKNLWLIAYVQDKNTKEIYQSAIIQSPEVKCFPVTGIEEAELSEELEAYVYPNPANKILKFEFNQQVSEEFDFKMFDQKGVEVLSERLVARSGKFDDIDVSKLSNGVYQIVVTGSNNIKIYKKLVVLNTN